MKNTIRQTSINIRDGALRSISISQFIDDFNACKVQDKQLMVAEHPVDLKNKRHSAYLAAVVEHLCHYNGIPTPEWTEKYTLDEPLFYGGDKLRTILLIESPVAFRKRNIFVSNNVMSRC